METPIELYKKILKGELKRFPNRFWVDPGAEENARQITKYLIEDILKWSKEDIKSNLTEMIFRKHKLSGMLEYTFNRSPYKAIENAYPGEYKAWDFKSAPKHIWENEEKRNEAIIDLLKRVNKDKFDELTNIDFISNGFGGLMDYLIRNKEFAKVETTKIEKDLNFKERLLKVSFNKSGGTSSRNGVTTRLTIPTSWIKELGITEEDREVIAKLEDGKIIIEPKI